MPPKKTTKSTLKKDLGKKDVPRKTEVDSDIEDSEPVTKKKKEEKKEGVNKTSSDYNLTDFSSESKTSDGRSWNMKISTWNVAGLRAWVKKNGLDFFKHEDPDIMCLQETKCSEKKLPPEVNIKGYHTYWLSAEKEGYSGVALYSKTKPIKIDYGIGISEHDTEGRVITAEYENFYLITSYVPNAGRGLVSLPKRMKWDVEFRNYIKNLDSKKPVILCGDLNVAHSEIDLANPKTNVKSAGFTKEERDGFTALLKEGFIDTFRHFYPDKIGAYTFWNYIGNARSRNVGWRLDYFVVSERFLSNVCDNVMRNQVFGSDHCPITLFVNM